MVKCANCGADVEPTAEKCGYCGATTDYGVKLAQQRDYQRQQQQQWQQQQQYQQQQQQRGRASEATQTDATNALWWSIAGLLVCCFPASVIGLVLSLRSRKLAAKHGLLVPGRSTLALVISGLGLALSAVGMVWFTIDQWQLGNRRDELAKVVAKGAGHDTIDQKTACALVELELLESGYQGKSGALIDGFKCTGKLEQSGDLARIDRVRFKADSAQHEHVACLRRGARWDFLDFRDLDESCEGTSRKDTPAGEDAGAADAAAPNATSSASAGPSAKP
jgi:hypothetical protein